MDIFEKQQRIEVIRKIVNVRWFNTAVLIALVITLRLISPRWSEAFEYVKIIILSVFAFGYNFVYWFFIRRPIEKISDRTLNLIALCQIIVDQILYTLIFYLAGTVESSSFLLYFMTILIASGIYKSGGIILSGLLTILLHNGILTLEYYRLIPHIIAYPGTVWFGNPEMTQGKVISFTFFMVIAVAFSVVLSNLIRNREGKLRHQRDQLSGQTQLLTAQTQQLARAKDDQEKANLELRQKIEELEKFSRVAMGREFKMSELKKEIKNLKEIVKQAEDRLTGNKK